MYVVEHVGKRIWSVAYLRQAQKKSDIFHHSLPCVAVGVGVRHGGVRWESPDHAGKNKAGCSTTIDGLEEDVS